MSQAIAAARASAAAAFGGASSTSPLLRPRPKPFALPLLPRGCLLAAALHDANAG